MAPTDEPMMLTSLLRGRAKPKTNPAFYPDELRLLLHEERAEHVFADPASVDLLTYNVFASLATHPDRAYLAYQLQTLGGSELAAPLRISLWSGRSHGPSLQPSSAYLAHVREQAGEDESLAVYREPIEVPVRIESPSVLALVDATLDRYPRGAGGRDRLLELIDAGLEHARRLSMSLTVAVVYESGTQGAQQLSDRMNTLRDPAALAAELPYRADLPPVALRELSWQQLLRIWEAELGYLDVSGQPVKAFQRYCAALGLR